MHCKKNRFRKSTAERTTASPWNQAQTRRIRQEEYQQKKELLDTPLRCKILTVTSNPTHHTLKLSISRSFFSSNHLFTSPSHILIDPCQLTPVSISTNKHPHWQELGAKCCEHNLRERLLVSFSLLNQNWRNLSSCFEVRGELQGWEDSFLPAVQHQKNDKTLTDQFTRL